MTTKENKTATEGSKQSETISELAHRHLRDKNHTTSDEELRNARVEYTEEVQVDEGVENLFEVDNSTIIPPFSGKDKLMDNNEEANEDDRNIPNPYDVLGS